MTPPLGSWPVSAERWQQIERALDYGAACVETIAGDEGRGEVLTVTIRVDPVRRDAIERDLRAHARDVDTLRCGGAVDWSAFFERRAKFAGGNEVLGATVAMIEVKIARRIEAERARLARKEERS